MSFLRVACICEETCESVWPPNASLYASSTCVHLRILAGPFAQGFRQQITSDVVLKYPLFNLFNDTEKTIFLFNYAASFICKKLGYFIYEALHIRETCNFI